jgi:hypothetical protein
MGEWPNLLYRASLPPTRRDFGWMRPKTEVLRVGRQRQRSRGVRRRAVRVLLALPANAPLRR